MSLSGGMSDNARARRLPWYAPALLLLLLIGCSNPLRSTLPGYEPKVIDSLAELEDIEQAYRVSLKQLDSEPTLANFSRYFPGHHRLPNQGETQRYQVYLDQRYVLKRDDVVVDSFNLLVWLYNLLERNKISNEGQLETSPRLYRQYMTFRWQGEQYLGYQIAERYCTSDRVNTMNCEY